MIYNRGVTHQNCQTLAVRGKVPIYGNLWVCRQNSKIWQFKNSKFTDDINIYRIICMLVKNIWRENLGITKWTSTHRICLTVEYWFLKPVKGSFLLFSFILSWSSTFSWILRKFVSPSLFPQSSFQLSRVNFQFQQQRQRREQQKDNSNEEFDMKWA